MPRLENYTKYREVWVRDGKALHSAFLIEKGPSTSKIRWATAQFEAQVDTSRIHYLPPSRRSRRPLEQLVDDNEEGQQNPAPNVIVIDSDDDDDGDDDDDDDNDGDKVTEAQPLKYQLEAARKENVDLRAEFAEKEKELMVKCAEREAALASREAALAKERLMKRNALASET